MDAFTAQISAYWRYSQDKLPYACGQDFCRRTDHLLEMVVRPSRHVFHAIDGSRPFMDIIIFSMGVKALDKSLVWLQMVAIVGLSKFHHGDCGIASAKTSGKALVADT